MENPLTQQLIKSGGISNIIGGFFVGLAYFMHPPSAPPETVASPLWQFVHISFMVSLLGGIFAQFALLNCYLQNGGTKRGVIGAVLAIISLIFIFGLDYSEVFIFPTLAVTFPEVIVKYGDGTMMPSVAFAFPASGILFLVGYLLFTYELKEVGIISKQSAYTLIVGTIVFSIGLSGLFPMMIVKVGAVMFGMGLILTGYSLIKIMEK
jgi:hypothetical protein